MAEYPNVPRSIGCVVSAKMATLAETQTVYGLKDVYDLLEIIRVDHHNRAILDEATKRVG